MFVLVIVEENCFKTLKKFLPFFHFIRLSVVWSLVEFDDCLISL